MKPGPLLVQKRFFDLIAHLAQRTDLRGLHFLHLKNETRVRRFDHSSALARLEGGRGVGEFLAQHRPVHPAQIAALAPLRSSGIQGRHLRELRPRGQLGLQLTSHPSHGLWVAAIALAQLDHAEPHLVGQLELLRMLLVVSLDLERRDDDSGSDVLEVHLLDDELVTDVAAELIVGHVLRLERLDELHAVAVALADALLHEVLDDAIGKAVTRGLEVIECELALDELVEAILVNFHRPLVVGRAGEALALQRDDRRLDELPSLLLGDDGLPDDGNDAVDQLRRSTSARV